MTAIAQALSSSISSRAREWARKRQGPDPASTHLVSGRIYILPTRAGVIFALIVFTMLLGAMNYNNNMGFALTFLLAGIAVVSIHHCHRNLADTYFHYLGSHPVFAGDDMEFRFVVENRSRVSRWQVHLHWQDRDVICNEIEADTRRQVGVRVATTSRGKLQVPRIQLSTRFPLGLFRAWAWVNMEFAELVYPAPAPRAARERRTWSGHTTTGYDRGGDDDFSGLRDYRLGDPPKHIAWKALARTGETLVTEYRSGIQDLIWIDWRDFAARNTEVRLAAMTRRVLDTDADGHRYGLRIPGLEISPSSGAAHRHDCLKALALFDAPDDARAPS